MCWAQEFADGVWFVRLSQLTDPELVLPTIAQTLGLQEVVGQPIAQTLSEYLGQKHLLLLLDNVEHVVMAAPEVGGCWLKSQPPSAGDQPGPAAAPGKREYPLVPTAAPDPDTSPPA